MRLPGCRACGWSIQVAIGSSLLARLASSRRLPGEGTEVVSSEGQFQCATWVCGGKELLGACALGLRLCTPGPTPPPCPVCQCAALFPVHSLPADGRGVSFSSLGKAASALLCQALSGGGKGGRLPAPLCLSTSLPQRMLFSCLESPSLGSIRCADSAPRPANTRCWAAPLLPGLFSVESGVSG